MKTSREAADADPLIAICGAGGVNLYNSAGSAWTADYLKVTGELDVDLRSNIAAEARAKIVYERLIDFCDDAGSKDALQFLMTREITHMKAFMTALDAMAKPPLSIGLIKPSPKIVDQYFNTSTGAGDDGAEDLLAPWNEGDDIERVDAPAFQDFADPKLGSRKAAPIDGPDLSAPMAEAAQPVQADHAGEDAKPKRAKRHR
jgi:Mn-containing catalase